ncbi:MAG: hypothetical protein C5S44_02600 [Candidatus Methanocomedens sp.]|nr:MAG: hypothetical protein C5S44_02600 [ANME-2 cluster archaeon]
MVHIETKEDLEVALKEYELLTNHYLHEDNMKNYALRNSVIAVMTIISIIMMIIAYESESIIIKQLFCIIMGSSGIIISFSYGIQYRRILRYQEVREARLEELEKNIEESNYFAPKTVRYGLELMDRKKLHICGNNLKPCIQLGIAESISSSLLFKLLMPWVLIFLLVIFLLVAVIGLHFGTF